MFQVYSAITALAAITATAISGSIVVTFAPQRSQRTKTILTALVFLPFLITAASALFTTPTPDPAEVFPTTNPWPYWAMTSWIGYAAVVLWVPYRSFGPHGRNNTHPSARINRRALTWLFTAAALATGYWATLALTLQ